MTTKEIREFINQTKTREDQALRDIVQVARTLIPLLKDRQMGETAKDLEARFFMLDAIKQEVDDFTKTNWKAMLEAITESLGGKP